MPEDIEQAQNQEGEVQAQEVTPTSEEPVETSDVEESSIGQEQTEEEIPAETQQEKKPTRLEKRLGKLLEENKNLKEKVQKSFEPRDTRLPWEKDEPLIRPEELETGIDPNALEQRIAQKINRTVEDRIREREQRQNYSRAMDEFISDVEKLPEVYPEFDENSDKFDPELSKALIEVYNSANIMPDGTFYPRKKGSEIAKQLLNIKKASETKGASQVTGKLVRQAAEAAVTPQASVEKELSQDDLNELMWKDPDAVAKAIERKHGIK